MAVQAESETDDETQAIRFQRTICVDMRQAVPLALLGLALVYGGAAAALHHWMNRHSSRPVAWSDCLLAPVRLPELKHSLNTAPVAAPPPAPAPVEPARERLADSVQTSTRNRLELVDNETAFFDNLGTLLKAGDDNAVLSNLSLVRRRSPKWFPGRQAELAQLEISIDARQGDLLALRGAASAYLNGADDRAEIMTASARLLLDGKNPEAARALLDEIVRKNPDYSPARELLKNQGKIPLVSNSL